VTGRAARSRTRERRGSAVKLAGVDATTLRVETDRRRPTARRLFAGLLEMSYVDLADPTHLEFEYMRRVGDVIDLAWPVGQPLAAVHLGGAACTLARYLAATRPRSRSDVYEHDEHVLRVAQAQLGLRPSRALRVQLGDARDLLARRADASADLVVGDAFSGTDVPAHLLTVELAGDVRRVLRHGGVYVLNVIDAAPLSVARRQIATLGEVFAELAVVATPKLLHGRASGNVVLLAADRPLPTVALADRARRAPKPEQLLGREALEVFAAPARPLRDEDVGAGP
jgi:spermidine synthase